METDKRLDLRKTVLASLLAGLSFVLTSFLSIPYPGGGYFSFGDVVILLASYLLGPFYGVAVGAIAAPISDLYVGMGNFAPFSLLAKGLFALLAGWAYEKKGSKPLIVLLYALAALSQVLVYAVAYLALTGAFSLSSLFDLVQAGGSLLLAGPLAAMVKAALPHMRKRH